MTNQSHENQKHHLVKLNFIGNSNIRYGCGAARAFMNTAGTSHPIQKMSCQWNREWTPQATIPVRHSDNMKIILRHGC